MIAKMSVKDNERAIIRGCFLFASWVPGKNGELSANCVGSTFGCYPLELPRDRQEGWNERELTEMVFLPSFYLFIFFFPSVAKGMFINNSSEHHNVKSTPLVFIHTRSAVMRTCPTKTLLVLARTQDVL